jgi:hypothetical protein
MTLKRFDAAKHLVRWLDENSTSVWSKCIDIACTRKATPPLFYQSNQQHENVRLKVSLHIGSLMHDQNSADDIPQKTSQPRNAFS